MNFYVTVGILLGGVLLFAVWAVVQTIRGGGRAADIHKTKNRQSWDAWFDSPGVSNDYMRDREQPPAQDASRT